MLQGRIRRREIQTAPERRRTNPPPRFASAQKKPEAAHESSEEEEQEASSNDGGDDEEEKETVYQVCASIKAQKLSACRKYVISPRTDSIMLIELHLHTAQLYLVRTCT